MKNHWQGYFLENNLFKNFDFALWNIFKCLEYLKSFKIGCQLQQIKVCGSYFLFLMLYQENECIADLTVLFPDLEVSKPVKSLEM